MTVVRNEFEMGENTPDARALRARGRQPPTSGTTTASRTIGNRSDIEKVPIERLRGFYKKYYQPDNALLDRCRQVRRDEGARVDRRSTSARSRSPTASCPTTYTEEPTQDGERAVTLRRVGRRPGASWRSTTCRRARIPTSPRRRAGAGARLDRPPAGCTRRWSRPRRRPARRRGRSQLHDPGIAIMARGPPRTSRSRSAATA